ncbi:MAG: hypothetical protein JRE40_06625 [Deltaproteobacteria bacterium]|nr:hypothetical protein [Deltaproteobacteria bacterium]
MDRRQFIECGLGALAVGIAAIFAGCSPAEKPQAQRLGNEDVLWNAAVGTEETSEPLELAYAKDTPAFFRDASFGKADPNFKPQIGGG